MGQSKTLNIIAVIIIGIVVAFTISANKETNSTIVKNSSSERQETKKSGFKFTASAMKKSLEESGYRVRTEQLKTLDSYVAEYKSDKLRVMFDIYHNDKDEIEWVEIIVDSSGYINLNKPETPPDPKVVEFTTKSAAYVYKFPFYKKDSEEMKKLSEWVDSNVASAIKEGNVIQTNIGDLYYNMYGQPYMRFLEISSTPKE